MGTEDLDYLREASRTSRRSGRVHEGQSVLEAETAAGPGVRGLRPSDLLNLPPEQRKVINWLSRRTQASFTEIQQGACGSNDIQEILFKLEEAGYIHQVLAGEGIFYRVAFAGNINRPGRGLSKEIWNLVTLDNPAFLKGLPLFRALDDMEIDAIACGLEERAYGRNEVILWQGSLAEHFYLIKHGVVGISRINQDRRADIQAYLQQGGCFGEEGLLIGQSSSSTYTALTPVELLLIKRQDFFEMLDRNSKTAVQLACVVEQELAETSARLASRLAEVNLALLFYIGEEGSPGVRANATLLGSSLAAALAENQAHKPGETVYTEFPSAEHLPLMFGFPAGTDLHQHPAHFDILVPRPAAGLPEPVQATLVMDRLLSAYTNIVISLPWTSAGDLSSLLGRASEIIIFTPRDTHSLACVAKLNSNLKTLVHPEKTRLFTVFSQAAPVPAAVMDNQSEKADFELPFPDRLPGLSDLTLAGLPDPLGRTVRTLADAMGLTNQVGVYIPTTVGVDQQADTSAYVEKTLAFMGKMFGGATLTQAQGVWNSDEAGLVSETIHIVRSYCTPSGMNQNLQQVIDFVETLKKELTQEAMALEVNQKLMLI